MPFKSKSQVRACFAKKNKDWNCKKWAKETGDIKGLPEKKSKKKFKEWMEEKSQNV